MIIIKKGMEDKKMETAKGEPRENFLRALSNYSECLKPFLRTAQDRYVASYYMVESQQFDLKSYCV